jgi:ECF transporter S component (folate family)
MREISRTQKLVLVALFIAMEIVLTRMLSIETPIMRIGFGFVPIAVCAMMFGPVRAGAAGAISDIIGVALFFRGGTPFLGFTLSAILVGVVFGLFLHKSKGHWFPIMCAAAINSFLIGMLLNTYWLTILTGNPFLYLLPTRIVQALIIFTIQFSVLNVIEKKLGNRIRGRVHHA